MDDRKKRLLGLAGGTALTLGLCGMLYAQHGTVKRLRAESEQIERDIAANRQLVAKTPELEREVIVQRETDEVVRTILPNSKDMPNFTRALHGFAQEAGVRISSLQEKGQSRSAKGASTDFEKAAYTVQFEGDAFQVLAFFNLVETSPRFMSIPTFQLSAAKKRILDAESSAPQLHAVTLEVETYVYDESGTPKRVQIDGYDRKRDQLSVELAQRRSALELPKYAYRGARNRRDPWIDPRVLSVDGPPPVPIPEQLALVDRQVEAAIQAEVLFQAFSTAETVVKQIKARRDLEVALAALEVEIRRVEAEAILSYSPAKSRFQRDVVDQVAALRLAVQSANDGQPSIQLLEQVIESMRTHLMADEFQLAVQAFEVVQPQLSAVPKGEPQIDALVAEAEHLAKLARTVIAFNQRGYEIRGLTYLNGRYVVVINGVSREVGDMVDPLTQVIDITHEYVEFLFEGVAIRKAIGN